jgi:transposase
MKRYKQTNNSSTTKKHSKATKSANLDEDMKIIHPDSAGIDIGSRSHFIAVPRSRDKQNVREFSSTTTGLLEIVEWFKECNIKTIAMESTGSYWIPVYEILEQNGFEVYLANPQYTKGVPGRKTDVLDCQWIQKLHSVGLIGKSFRPHEHALKLRALTRQHTSLVEHRSPHILHMQKAMHEMNIQLSTHIRDITGVTGMRIINAIIEILKFLHQW